MTNNALALTRLVVNDFTNDDCTEEFASQIFNLMSPLPPIPAESHAAARAIDLSLG